MKCKECGAEVITTTNANELFNQTKKQAKLAHKTRCATLITEHWKKIHESEVVRNKEIEIAQSKYIGKQ